MAKEAGQPGQGHAISFRESELKICELCGNLNLASNKDCFICGWHGRFERDPVTIRAAIELSVRRYGRLELQHLTDLRTYQKPAPLTLPTRIRLWFQRVWLWLRS
ncbi:MAG TPA: hypothetical protein VFA07_07585 [Chthonomonadaceae bacterium]|nr:hypothetical protein [Chthonomonadaceae bacterium]